MHSDDPLSRVLQSWRVTPRLSAHFRTAVWQRIEGTRRVGSESWSAYLRTHLTAWTIVAVVVTGGSGLAGLTAAKAKDEATRQTMVAAYVSIIDARAHVRP